MLTVPPQPPQKQPSPPQPASQKPLIYPSSTLSGNLKRRIRPNLTSSSQSNNQPSSVSHISLSLGHDGCDKARRTCRTVRSPLPHPHPVSITSQGSFRSQVSLKLHARPVQNSAGMVFIQADRPSRKSRSRISPSARPQSAWPRTILATL
jgi:hypothetical protein